jgi:hypothetical protein
MKTTVLFLLLLLGSITATAQNNPPQDTTKTRPKVQELKPVCVWVIRAIPAPAKTKGK